MSLPFGITVGDILLHDGRRLRFEADLGDDDLHITDVRTAARLRVPVRPSVRPRVTRKARARKPACSTSASAAGRPRRKPRTRASRAC